MRYKHIIFDLDDTLILYNPSEIASITTLLRRRSITPDEKLTQTLLELAWDEWDAAGLCKTDQPEINARFHELYRSFRVRYFDRLKLLIPLCESSEALGGEFYDLLAQQSPVCGGAMETVEKLSERFTLSVATNGLEYIQTSRAAPFRRYLSNIFTSESLKFAKPSARFFEGVLSRLGAQPGECLMVGDSLSMDVLGAQSAGIDGCWINPKGRPSEGKSPKYEIKSIAALIPLLNEEI